MSSFASDMVSSAMSALTIVPSTILLDVTELSAGTLRPIAFPRVRIKKSEPVAGALANIMSLPSIANPSLGLVPLLGF